MQNNWDITDHLQTDSYKVYYQLVFSGSFLILFLKNQH